MNRALAALFAFVVGCSLPVDEPEVGSTESELTTFCVTPSVFESCLYAWWPARSASSIQSELSTPRKRIRVVALAAVPGAPGTYAVMLQYQASATSPVIWEGDPTTTLSAQVEDWRTSGIQPVIVAASGTGSSARITVVGAPGASNTLEWDLDETTFIQRTDERRSTFTPGVLVSVAPYGELYAAIWQATPERVPFDFNFAGNADEAREIINAVAALDARVTLLVQQPDDRFLVVQQDDDISGNIRTSVQATSSSASSFLSQGVSSGYFPRSLSVGPGPRGLAYTLVLEKAKAPAARLWQARGPSVPAALQPVEDLIKTTMMTGKVSTAAVALTYQGRLVFARGYTYAPAGYPVTESTSTFRSASIAKPVTATAVLGMVQRGEVRLDDAIAAWVEIWHMDPRGANITIDNLLQHRGGWDRSLVGDVMFKDRQISEEYGFPLPLTLESIIVWNQAQELQWDPGTHYAYSNYGFALLGKLLENVSGVGYEAYMRQAIWNRIGVPSRVRAAHRTHAPEEVRHRARDPYTWYSVYDSAPHWVPYVEGGWNFETTLPVGMWLVSAPDYARFLVALERRELLDEPTTQLMRSGDEPTKYLRGLVAYQLAGGMTGWGHTGGIAGTSTAAFMRADAIGVVVFFASDAVSTQPAGALGTQLNTLLSQVTAWPAGDLFPSQGITP